VPEKVEQINDFLFIDKSNRIQIGMDKMRVDDSKKSMRCNNVAWGIPEMSVPTYPR